MGRPLLAALGVGATMLVARDARADFDFQFGATVSGAWLRQTPSFSMAAVSTSAREMGENSVRMRRSMGMLGVGADVDLTIDDRWRVPLIGGAFWWPVGGYDTMRTSVDGSIAELRPWTMLRIDALLPGIGQRFKYRRFMWSATIRTGVSFTAIDGDLAAGTERVKLELGASTFLLQGEIEGCRRLDPTTRVCLTFSPRLYEYQFMNGATFGLRMEWGQ